jgi:hypothetical protein
MKRRVFELLTVLVVIGISFGCDDGKGIQDKGGKTGKMKVALVGTGTSGDVYRLRDGVFDVENIEEGATISVSTEDDPNAESIDLAMDPGTYSVYLKPGYRMERITSENDAGVSEEETFFSENNNTMKRGKRSDMRRGDTIEKADKIDVEVTLISDNPKVVELEANDVADVKFVFKVGDDIVPAEGILSIEIEIEEDTDSEICWDEFEPNDDLDEATQVDLNQPIEAMACPGNDELYIFDAPVPQGDFFDIEVVFSHSISDIDVILVDSEMYIVDIGDSETDNEYVSAVSDGNPYILLVYPYSGDEGNPYTIRLKRTDNDCCTISEYPGCDDEEVEACVCSIDPYCCETAYDDVCVEEAQIECGLDCGLPSPVSDCCNAAESPGCTDAVIEACVCSFDEFCCIEAFDDVCVEIAIEGCDAEC